MKSFSEQFKERIQTIDGLQEVPKARYDVTELATAVRMALKPPTMPVERRYNIHKRSLPEGLNKVVMYNLSKLEAEWMIHTKLKTLLIQDNKDKETLIYYDSVPVDATLEEESVFHNPKKLFKEDNGFSHDEPEGSLLGSSSEWI